MTIIDKLKHSIEQNTGLTFYYDDRDNLNEILDDAVFPCVVSHLVEQGAIVDALGVYHERLTMEVAFEDLPADDLDGIENERQIDGMKRSALKWLTAFRQDENLKLESINSTSRHYMMRPDNYDVISTGFAVVVTFSEVDGISECDL